MKTKLDVAFGLLDAIQSLELSPEEISAVNIEWISRNMCATSMNQKCLTAVSELLHFNQSAEGLLTSLDERVRELQRICDDLQKHSSVLDVSELKKSANADLEPLSPSAEKVGASAESSQTKVSEQKPANVKRTAKTKSVSDKEKKSAGPKREVIANPPKGYSKYGVRLGRKPRAEKVVSAPASEPATIPSTTLVESMPSTVPKTENAEQTETVKPPVKAPATEPDDSYIESLKYGKTYSLDSVYLVNGFYVCTNQLLRGEAGVQPVGVIVPYVFRKIPGYILVSYRDEPLITVEKAQKYARSRKPFQNHRWRIKTSEDDIFIKQQSLDVMNEIFKKMGGDKLDGKYVDGRDTYFGNSFRENYKIRLVCRYSETTDE